MILSAEPHVLLVDEIIHSIDAYLRKVFLQKLVQLISEKMLTVIMVNLNFHDIENLLDRVILLRDGEIMVDEGIDDLKAKVKKVIASHPPLDPEVPVIFQVHYPDNPEYYVYPYETRYQTMVEGEWSHLNLTEIVSAFIGGEYAD